jgi:hypothetical protein
MYTIEAVDAMLAQIADDIPGMFFEQLNGGVLLQEACKKHPQSQGDLYIMGAYCNRRDLGRHINIYYGSFMQVYANAPAELLYQKLRDSLLHELTHHLESLAGERGLEIQDQIRLAEYRKSRQNSDSAS